MERFILIKSSRGLIMKKIYLLFIMVISFLVFISAGIAFSSDVGEIDPGLSYSIPQALKVAGSGLSFSKGEAVMETVQLAQAEEDEGNTEAEVGQTPDEEKEETAGYVDKETEEGTESVEKAKEDTGDYEDADAETSGETDGEVETSGETDTSDEAVDAGETEGEEVPSIGAEESGETGEAGETEGITVEGY